MFELSIKVSNEEKKLISKHLIYDDNVTINHDDPTLKYLVELAIKDFNDQVSEVRLSINLFW